jgi:predicted phage-related endonuclease
MVEILHPKTREEWLALRSQNVGASEAGALLGIHDYQTAYSLWAIKSGALTPEQVDTPSLRRGRLLEPIALQVIREEHPDWQVKANPMPGGFYYCDPELRLGCTPDALAVRPDRPGTGILQVKSVERSVFRSKWHAEDGEIELPLWIAVQTIVEAHLTGAKWATVAALVVGHGIDVVMIDVPLHEGVLARIREKVKEFWRLVETKQAPEPDYGRDAGIIEQLYRDATGEEIDLSTDNRILALLDEREEAAAQKKVAEDRLHQIKAEILNKLGAACVGRCADGRVITAKTVVRREYIVKATSFRDLRVKAAREQAA